MATLPRTRLTRSITAEMPIPLPPRSMFHPGRRHGIDISLAASRVRGSRAGVVIDGATGKPAAGVYVRAILRSGIRLISPSNRWTPTVHLTYRDWRPERTSRRQRPSEFQHQANRNVWPSTLTGRRRQRRLIMTPGISVRLYLIRGRCDNRSCNCDFARGIDGSHPSLITWGFAASNRQRSGNRTMSSFRGFNQEPIDSV
jgi:hypothetical protein